MKKVVIVFAFILFACLAQGQNLVPNPSFESYNVCPIDPSHLGNAFPWFQPSWGTPDYLNSCTVNHDISVPANAWGFQNAHTGVAYAGFFACIVYFDSVVLNYREYCEVKLNSPLQAGTEYFVTFFVSLADSMYFATDAVSAYFSSDTVKNNSGYFLSSIIPQVENIPGNFLSDQTEWTKISGKFTAVGGEQFLTIGNFKDHFNTDTITVRSGWMEATGLSDYSGGYYYLDDVCVSPDSLYAQTWTGLTQYKLNQNLITIFPNPANEEIFIQTKIKINNFSLFNTFGTIVKKGEFNNAIKVKDLVNGIYIIDLDEKYFYKIVINH